MDNPITSREAAAMKRRAALERLKSRWNEAPASILVLAGPYVAQIIDFCENLSQELDASGCGPARASCGREGGPQHGA